MPSLPLARASLPEGESGSRDSRSTFAYRFRERCSFSPGENAGMRAVSTVCKKHRNRHDRAWRDEPAGTTIEALCNCQ